MMFDFAKKVKEKDMYPTNRAQLPGLQEYAKEVERLTKRVHRMEDSLRYVENDLYRRHEKLADFLKIKWVHETKVPGHYEKVK